ncbi:GAF domain-containing protein [Chloropicon primus]|uniref:GAF domain-containing protein n=1 Tax=Chloropicon primus TaxID=1764295 RepID=A0A5B8MME2_9CHLO|nr:GAF domain-containing protein [Chloropicon primus]UPR00830.1 GAF domain-containing protein [Chloropicon primus]|eukprot:QDZ21619.1 GAF domain-containing protein [Chloropicon primus]
METREREYAEVEKRIHSLLERETDFVAAMATVACELHHTFGHFHWTGFYRSFTEEGQGHGSLVIGPYQGSHGCLRIPFGKGVCGAAAGERRTQLVRDVHAFPGHIACSSETLSEIVVPVLHEGELVAVLDVDSNFPDAFTEGEDQKWLERICTKLGTRDWSTGTRVL